MKLAWNRLPEVKDLKTYAMSILLSTMKMRHDYDFQTLDLDGSDVDVYDFSASNEGKLKMFLKGWSQTFS